MGKPRILLLRANPCRGPYVPLYTEAICPPLGLMYLAAVLRERHPDAYDLRILDPGLESLQVEEVGRICAREAPQLIGISALATEMENCRALVKAAREAVPAAQLVIGGPCVSSRSAWPACDPDIACAVQGEGEETFAELVPRLLAGESLLEVAGLYTRSANGDVVFTGPRAAIEDLDGMPFPAWDLIDLPRYSSALTMNYGLLAAKPYAPLFTSRGCPWTCTYCHNVFGKKARFRSAENVLREMSMLVKRYGIREFHFFDDVFNLDRARSARIMEMIADRGWNLRLAFPNGLRGDILTAELLRSYRRAGTYLICFAVETVTPRIQKMIQKHVKLEETARMIRVARDEGIIPLGFFMLGFPTETEAELRATIDWACESALLKAYFFSVIPFEGTMLADQAREATPGVPLDNTVTFHSEDCYYATATGVNLPRIQRQAYFKFYLRPGRLLRFFVRYPRKLWFFINTAKSIRGLLIRSWREVRV